MIRIGVVTPKNLLESKELNNSFNGRVTTCRHLAEHRSGILQSVREPDEEEGEDVGHD